MLFNSLEYLIFMPMALALYFALPARYRWIFLLISSYYFYTCWKVSYIFLLVGSTLTDYICGLRIERDSRPRVRKRYLYASLIVNLGLLFTYKYLEFFSGSLRAVFEFAGLHYPVPEFNMVLPVGISFYTFQTLGYTIDVYRGRIPAERNLFRFALYVTYFPQLVAGPIERAKNLLPQLRRTYSFDYTRVRNGLCLVLWGLFKKLVIADRIAEYTNTVFSNPDLHSGLQVWAADYLFIIQLYCDFSGYTDIAIGTALVMGIKLMENFRQPLLGRSIGDLWTRWHISLTTWFRDYLYVYIGGRRGSVFRMSLGIFVVFLVNGLWHGANWTFVIFGAIHGLGLIGNHLTKLWMKRYGGGFDKRHPHLCLSTSFLIALALFMFSGSFFRAETVTDAFTLVRNSFDFSGGLSNLNLFQYPADLWISLAGIVILYASEFIAERAGFANWFDRRSALLKWLLVAAGLFSIAVLGKWNAISFIYFQF